MHENKIFSKTSDDKHDNNKPQHVYAAAIIKASDHCRGCPEKKSNSPPSSLGCISRAKEKNKDFTFNLMH